MSCYDEDGEEPELANWLAPENNPLQTPRRPSPIPEDGICRRCWRRRGPRGLSSLALCPACRGYLAHASRLDDSTYCQCQCMCRHSMERASDELDSDVDMTESEGSEDEFLSGPEFEISREEVQNLRRGLSAWEIHDLERLGYPLYRLMEQLPEIRIVHERGQLPHEAPARPYRICIVCNKEREYLVEQALVMSHINLCHNCQKPLVRHVGNFTSSVEPHQCFCHCSCLVDQPVSDDEGPIFLPFIMNLEGATPSPDVLRLLQSHGFCHRNQHAEAVREAMKTGHNIPSYEEILSNSIAWFILQTSEEYMESRLDNLAVATTFPNGNSRDPDTDSSLPKDLENFIIRYIDSNAFGHQTRQKWEVEGPDPNKLKHMTIEEVRKWVFITLVLQEISLQRLYRMSQESYAKFALWSVEYADDFGIDDDEGDSVCSASVLSDETSWQEWIRQQCGCGEDQVELTDCCAKNHEMRHIARRLERIALRGSYPVRQEMIQWASQRWQTHREMMVEEPSDSQSLWEKYELSDWRRCRERDQHRSMETEEMETDIEQDLQEEEEDEDDDNDNDHHNNNNQNQDLTVHIMFQHGPSHQ